MTTYRYFLKYQVTSRSTYESCGGILTDAEERIVDLGALTRNQVEEASRATIGSLIRHGDLEKIASYPCSLDGSLVDDELADLRHTAEMAAQPTGRTDDGDLSQGETTSCVGEPGPVLNRSRQNLPPDHLARVEHLIAVKEENDLESLSRDDFQLRISWRDRPYDPEGDTLQHILSFYEFDECDAEVEPEWQMRSQKVVADLSDRAISDADDALLAPKLALEAVALLRGPSTTLGVDEGSSGDHELNEHTTDSPNEAIDSPGDPEESAPQRARRRRGHPKPTPESIEKDRQLVLEWRRARDAGVSKKEFAAGKGKTFKEVEDTINRHRKHVERNG